MRFYINRNTLTLLTVYCIFFSVFQNIYASTNNFYTNSINRNNNKRMRQNNLISKDTNNPKKQKTSTEYQNQAETSSNNNESEFQQNSLKLKIKDLEKKIDAYLKECKDEKTNMKFSENDNKELDEIEIELDDNAQFLRDEANKRKEYAKKIEEYLANTYDEIDFNEIKRLINDSLNDIETQNWNYLTTDEKRDYKWKGTLKSLLDIIIIDKECLSYLYPPFYVLCKIGVNYQRYINYECKSVDNIINYSIFLKVILNQAKRLLLENKLDGKINIKVPCINVCIKIINYLMLYIIFEIQHIFDTTDKSHYRQLLNLLRKNKISPKYISNNRIDINFFQWKENKLKDFLIKKNDKIVSTNQKSFNAESDFRGICRLMLKNFYEMRNNDITDKVNTLSNLFNESFHNRFDKKSDKKRQITMCVFFIFLSKDKDQCHNNINYYIPLFLNELIDKEIKISDKILNVDFYGAVDSFIDNVHTYYTMFHFDEKSSIILQDILEGLNILITLERSNEYIEFNINIFILLYEKFLGVNDELSPLTKINFVEQKENE